MKKLVKNVALLSMCAGLLLPGTASAKSLQADLNRIKHNHSNSQGSTRMMQSLDDLKLYSSDKKAEKKPQFSDDTIVIKYKSPLSRAEHSILGASIIKQDSVHKYTVVKVKNKAAQQKALKAYLKNSNVISAQPSVLFQQLGTPDPKAFKQYQLSMLHADEAQALAGNRKVKVAVIDTGIDVKHPELKNKVISSYNAINPLNPGLPDSHGTHVAGIIAGEKNNGIGGYGINPNAEILSIDIFNRGFSTTDFTIVQAIDKAIEQGAKVINMSIGSWSSSTILEEAIQRAVSKGIVIVAAAGNDAMDIPNYPASYEGVISVSSVDSSKKLSYFSNFGPGIDIAAPGEDIYSSIYEPEKLSSFRTMSGTSMATPIVAGAASLLLAKHPGLTPQQVEYILDATATDLGSKGYDTKYGSGLVNPAAALKYNIKNLPKILVKKWTDKEIQNEASRVYAAAPISISKAFTMPSEQHWIQFGVTEGEYIQTSLKSAGQYDHKLMIKFFASKQSQSLEVDNVKEGKNEGKLIKAPFTGTMAIGVKDVNGHYDASKRDSYTLNVEKAKNLPEDTSTLEKMKAVSSLPYSDGDNTFASGEKVDNDFFTFTADADKLYSLKLSGVAGVNSTINVYREDSLIPEPEPGEPPMTEQEKLELLKSMLESDKSMPGDFRANRNGSGDGETLAFPGEKGVKYIIKVSNKPEMNEEEDFFMFFFGPSPDSNMQPESSITPYTLSISSREQSIDEDDFGMEGTGDDEEGGSGDEGDLNGDGQWDIEDEILQMQQLLDSYQEHARPYQLGDKAAGALQSQDDTDIFSISPDKSGIYKLNIPKTNGQGFSVTLVQATSEKLDDGRTIPSLRYIGENSDYSGWGALKTYMYTGLQKGGTYYMIIHPNYYENDFNYENYTISSSFVYGDASDKYEDNDLFKDHAKTLPANGKVTGNFAMPGDLDAFYFAPSQTGIYSVLAERGTASAAQKSQLPAELFSKIYTLPVIIEDVNGNRKYDKADYDSYNILESGLETGNTYGSFKAVKGKKYFIVLDHFTEGADFSLLPYHLTVAPAVTADEDAKSTVKNNVPSKPIALKAVNSKVFSASAYLNSGKKNGDEDWFTFTLKKDASVKIDLMGGSEADLSLSLYQKGKLLNFADYYPEGDNEWLSRTLKKGTYHIKVRDYFGNSSIKPYQVKVTLK
ncbi:S8 family serine peptidase [Peribacillus kribbensis]|uniref:S8 family serine peptidase n=1 Tax=Peribacillus kribbensis TaxID=356658 RepID=UPI00041DCFC0|nr:S8 family serine peptidase [Peribacillus kribbensis]